MEDLVKFWNHKRVLITGNTGFKGCWLTLLLQRLGADVTGYSLDAPTTPSMHAATHIEYDSDVSEFHGDVRELSKLVQAMQLAEPQIVFHLAAQSLVSEGYKNPILTYSTNVMGTANVLEAVRNTPSVKATIIITSDKCYAETIFAQEADALGGSDPYSSSKACAELVAAAYRDSFGINVATARAGNVIGGGDWSSDRLLPDSIRALAQKQVIVLRNPDAVRPWQHVLDPLNGYLLLAQRMFDSLAYASAWNFGPHLSDVKPVSYIIERLGVDWRRADEVTMKENSYLTLDSSKANSLLQYAPRWHLDYALDQTMAWYSAWLADEDMRHFTIRQIEEHAQHERVHS